MLKNCLIYIIFSSVLFSNNYKEIITLFSNNIYNTNQTIDFKRELSNFLEIDRELSPYSYKNINNNQKAIFYNQIGYFYYKITNYSLAESYYYKALTFNSNAFYYIYNNLGVLFLNQKKYEKALNNFDQAAAIKSDNSNLYINMSISYFMLHKYTKAFNCYKIALSIDKKYTQDRVNQQEKAEAYLQEAKVTSSNNDKMIHKIEKAYYSQTNFQTE